MGNRPLRNLLALAAVTAVMLIAAIAAVLSDQSSVRTNFVPHPLFEGLSARLDQVDRIVYTSSRGMTGEEVVSISRREDGVWGVASRAGYPANEELVRNVLLGVGNMEAYEPRTANPEWHRNLGLMKPEDIGTAIRVELFSGEERLAGLLVGKVPERAVDVNGEGLIYVRRDGEDQTWLARGRLPLHKQAIDWLDTRFIDIPREEVARVTLWAGTERPVVMERGSPGAADFEIVNMPEMRASRGAPVVNKVAGSSQARHAYGRTGRCALGKVRGGRRRRRRSSPCGGSQCTSFALGLQAAAGDGRPAHPDDGGADARGRPGRCDGGPG